MEFIHRRYKNIPLIIKAKFLNTKFHENPFSRYRGFRSEQSGRQTERQTWRS